MSDATERVLSLVKIVDSPFCVAIDDGNAAHKEIANTLDEGMIAVISFFGVRRLTTAFLNAAIGQLYNEYSEELIRKNLRVIDASQDDLRLLKRVVDNAKAFFANPKRKAAAIRNMIGDE